MKEYKKRFGPSEGSRPFNVPGEGPPNIQGVPSFFQQMLWIWAKIRQTKFLHMVKARIHLKQKGGIHPQDHSVRMENTEVFSYGQSHQFGYPLCRCNRQEKGNLEG